MNWGNELSFGDSLEVFQKHLPHEIHGWRAEPRDQVFDAKTIFDYIDGAGEVYRAYDMRYCLSRHYKKSGNPDIMLDIFDMGVSRNAFGVFTHDQDGEELGIGQGALYRYGWLRFWKEKYFISIYPEEETPSSKRATLELGGLVASLVRNEGRKPDILSFLPERGLRKRSVRYFHDHGILNYHYYLADENILLLGKDTEAVLADYKRNGRASKVLIVLYSTPEEATRAHKSLVKSYLPEAEKSEIVSLQNGMWAGALSAGKTLIFVPEADSPFLAEQLLKEVVGRARTEG